MIKKSRPLEEEWLLYHFNHQFQQINCGYLFFLQRPLGRQRRVRPTQRLGCVRTGADRAQCRRDHQRRSGALTHGARPFCYSDLGRVQKPNNSSSSEAQSSYFNSVLIQSRFTVDSSTDVIQKNASNQVSKSALTRNCSEIRLKLIYANWTPGVNLVMQCFRELYDPYLIIIFIECPHHSRFINVRRMLLFYPPLFFHQSPFLQK